MANNRKLIILNEEIWDKILNTAYKMRNTSKDMTLREIWAKCITVHRKKVTWKTFERRYYRYVKELKNSEKGLKKEPKKIKKSNKQDDIDIIESNVEEIKENHEKIKILKQKKTELEEELGTIKDRELELEFEIEDIDGCICDIESKLRESVDVLNSIIIEV